MVSVDYGFVSGLLSITSQKLAFEIFKFSVFGIDFSLKVFFQHFPTSCGPIRRTWKFLRRGMAPR